MTLSFAKENDLIFFMDGDVGLEEKALYEPIETSSDILKEFIANEKKNILISNDDTSFWTAVAKNAYMNSLNTGIMVLKSTQTSIDFVDEWWRSMTYTTPLEIFWDRTFRQRWPWEQERATYLKDSVKWGPLISVTPYGHIKGFLIHEKERGRKKKRSEISIKILHKVFKCDDLMEHYEPKQIISKLVIVEKTNQSYFLEQRQMLSLCGESEERDGVWLKQVVDAMLKTVQYVKIKAGKK